ncbi:conserved Plasmodium protein, unknown function [Plasmodium ovale wallikeri]|uniref:Uncharacterized protein n=1 Tax=Plasmodium ovale wallikeri TaxID=864142 RepID=A0A1A8ZEU2_PLAOA|nr:conserved Plasmodium protein, unknown function [Plasmodium ovale wallikeri]
MDSPLFDNSEEHNKEKECDEYEVEQYHLESSPLAGKKKKKKKKKDNEKEEVNPRGETNGETAKGAMYMHSPDSKEVEAATLPMSSTEKEKRKKIKKKAKVEVKEGKEDKEKEEGNDEHVDREGSANRSTNQCIVPDIRKACTDKECAGGSIFQKRDIQDYRNNLLTESYKEGEEQIEEGRIIHLESEILGQYSNTKKTKISRGEKGKKKKRDKDCSEEIRGKVILGGDNSEPMPEETPEKGNAEWHAKCYAEAKHGRNESPHQDKASTGCSSHGQEEKDLEIASSTEKLILMEGEQEKERFPKREEENLFFEKHPLSEITQDLLTRDIKSDGIKEKKKKKKEKENRTKEDHTKREKIKKEKRKKDSSKGKDEKNNEVGEEHVSREEIPRLETNYCEIEEESKERSDSFAHIDRNENNDEAETSMGISALSKIYDAGNMKHLETHESKMCVVNSIQAISSTSLESVKSDEGSPAYETFSYSDKIKTFDLLSYVRSSITNCRNILQEENLEIYERKCVEEIISFHKLKLKMLKKKEREFTISRNVDSFVEDETKQNSSNSSEESKEKIIKNYEQFNSSNIDESDEHGHTISRKVSCKHKVTKKKETYNMLGTGNICATTEEDRELRHKMGEKIVSNKNLHANNSLDVFLNSQKEDVFSCIKGDPGKRRNKDREYHPRDYTPEDNPSSENIPNGSNAEDGENKGRGKRIMIEKGKKEETLSENADVEKEENPSNSGGSGGSGKNIFETIFNFYVGDLDEERNRNNDEFDGKMEDAKKVKGMDLELFLHFAKHYKIIKSLLTKNELEKIFLNESKGYTYIQHKHFKKVLMVCAQIAFTKPPHRVNFTDTKKIYISLISWLSNNAPDNQKKAILKIFPLTSSTVSIENSRKIDSQKNDPKKMSDTKNSILKSRQSSICVIENKKKFKNNFSLSSSQKYDLSPSNSEKPKYARYNSSANLRK